MTPPENKLYIGRVLKEFGNPPRQIGDFVETEIKKHFDSWILSGCVEMLGPKEYDDYMAKKQPIEETEEKKRPEDAKYTSFYEDDELLAEEIYLQTSGVVNFALYDKKSGKVSYGLPDSKIQPIPEDGALLEGAVLLPTAAEEYGDVPQLMDEIQAHIHKYLDVGKEYEPFATCYILLSWVYDMLTTLCYLRAFGDTGCGKSRFLDVIGQLCYKPIMASGCITPAPIYRMLKKWKGTIILDEADFKNSDEYNEVVTILNCGFERRRPIIRCHKDSPDDIQILPSFSPKVLATRRRFKDPALESRCLTETLRETRRKDIPPILPKEFYLEQEHLRNKLLMFRFRYRAKINPDDIQHIDLGDIEPRLKQATGSFAVLLSSIPGLLDTFRVFLQEFNADLIEQRSETYEGWVINALFSLSQVEGVPSCDETNETHETKILPRDIVEQIKLSAGPELTPQKVGGILRTLGLETKDRRIGKEKGRFLKWDAARMEILRKRYVSSVSSVSMIGGTAPDMGQELLEHYPDGIGNDPRMAADLKRGEVQQ